jgi:hypothetical protein
MDRPPIAAIPAVGAAAGHEFLVAKTHAPVPAVAGLNAYAHLVKKHSAEEPASVFRRLGKDVDETPEAAAVVETDGA